MTSPLSITREVVAQRDGKDVCEWTMKGEHLQVKCLSFGCAITSILAKDKAGEAEEVTLSHRDYTTLALAENRGPYFGCVAGRVANRIAKGKFSLNGKEYSLAINNGENTNHGGVDGFDQRVWDSKALEDKSGVEFKYVSPDGEENFPGTVEVTITYRVVTAAVPQGQAQVSVPAASSLEIEYTAVLLPLPGMGGGVLNLSTPINLTNHTYFNLSGNCRTKISAPGGHSLMLHSDTMTPVSPTQIPTGEIRAVAGTVFDYRQPVALAERIPVTDGCGRPGLDHNWVVNGALAPASSSEKSTHSSLNNRGEIRPVAVLSEKRSGRVLTVQSSQPGVQVYTANWLSQDDDKDFPLLQHNGVALESQHFPDSINQSHAGGAAGGASVFPSTVLAPGEVYSQKTIWTFSVEGA